MIVSSGIDTAFQRNILRLISGEGIGRFIGFIATPVVTRLYSPADFGVLAVFTSLCALCYPFCSLKYSLAIPLHSNDRIAVSSIVACCLILAANTLIISTALYLFHWPVLSFFSSGSIDALWYFIPLAFFLYGLSEIMSYYSTRCRDFSTIAKVTVTQKGAGTLTKIILGLFHFNVTGLLIGNIMYESGGITVYLRAGWDRLKENLRFVTWRKIGFALKRYISFPLYRVPSQILLNASGSLPILYFAWRYGSVTTGRISLAIAILSIPVAVVCSSVGKAFYGEIASPGRCNSNEISALTKRLMIRLLAISIVPFALIVCFGSWIFATFFGAEWTQSGVFARYLCFYLIFRLVYSPISDGIFNVFEQQKYVFLLEVSRIVIVASSLFVSYFCNICVDTTVVIYSLGLTAQYIISILFVFHLLRRAS